MFTIVVTQIPFLLTLWYSLETYNLNYPDRPQATSRRSTNYKKIFSDRTFRIAALNTLQLTVIPVHPLGRASVSASRCC